MLNWGNIQVGTPSCPSYRYQNRQNRYPNWGNAICPNLELGQFRIWGTTFVFCGSMNVFNYASVIDFGLAPYGYTDSSIPWWKILEPLKVHRGFYGSFLSLQSQMRNEI